MRIPSMILLSTLFLGCVEPLEDLALETQTQSLLDLDGNGIPETTGVPTAADFVNITTSITTNITEDGYTFSQSVRYDLYPVLEFTEEAFGDVYYHQCQLIPLPNTESDTTSVSIRGQFSGQRNATPGTINNAPSPTIVFIETDYNMVVGNFTPIDSSRPATVAWDGWVTLQYSCFIQSGDYRLDFDPQNARDVHVGTYSNSTGPLERQPRFGEPRDLEPQSYDELYDRLYRDR